jgi:iron complex transport system ATP-binding protein
LEAGAIAERGVLDMSGGERARVLLARLLATRAPLLVADEPAAGLDPDAQFLSLERLRARAEAGAAVMVTLHDLTLAARACDRLAVLHAGRLRALAPPARALSAEILAEVFGLEGALVESAAGLTLAARRRG